MTDTLKTKMFEAMPLEMFEIASHLKCYLPCADHAMLASLLLLSHTVILQRFPSFNFR